MQVWLQMKLSSCWWPLNWNKTWRWEKFCSFMEILISNSSEDDLDDQFEVNNWFYYIGSNFIKFCVFIYSSIHTLLLQLKVQEERKWLTWLQGPRKRMKAVHVCIYLFFDTPGGDAGPGGTVCCWWPARRSCGFDKPSPSRHERRCSLRSAPAW